MDHQMEQFSTCLVEGELTVEVVPRVGRDHLLLSDGSSDAETSSRDGCFINGNVWEGAAD